ncbi:hypothetical protein [Marinicella meishanensis]|uniref:hypothetical protein n=1 Tax=Marinicella meishanensis TaxID=2873263 RepID=UPI001CC10200|nr:hypothetical protein [Marinicella sp. NBU2979]
MTQQKPICQLCGTDQNITFHHLIPRTCHKNKWFRKNFSREDMRTRGVDVCRRCHSFIHQQHSEKHLGRELNTLEKILADEQLKPFIEWAKKHR